MSDEVVRPNRDPLETVWGVLSFFVYGPLVVVMLWSMAVGVRAVATTLAPVGWYLSISWLVVAYTWLFIMFRLGSRHDR